MAPHRRRLTRDALSTTAEALKDAAAVLIEVDIHQLEENFSAMIPEFARGAVVHVQSHGYWPAARLTPILRKAAGEDLLVTEAPAPTHAARINGTVVTPKGLRKGIQIATVPASRSDFLTVLPVDGYEAAIHSAVKFGRRTPEEMTAHLNNKSRSGASCSRNRESRRNSGGGQGLAV